MEGREQGRKGQRVDLQRANGRHSAQFPYEITMATKTYQNVLLPLSWSADAIEIQ
jgi:hypothetical protein